jgi:hypothetical protein
MADHDHSSRVRALRLARRFADTSDALLAPAPLERTLHTVAQLAPANVHGAESASVTVVGRDGSTETPAFTGENALEAADAGCAADGPILSSATEGLLLRIDDTAGDPRWPLFAERVRALGLRSVLTCPLRLDRTRSGSAAPRAALALYSARPYAFDEFALDAAGIYATHASAALTVSRATDSLRRAMHTRQLIGEAAGILMERHRIDSPKAFDLLVRASQDLNVKLRTVADRVVHTGQDPRSLRRRDLPPESERPVEPAPASG